MASLCLAPFLWRRASLSLLYPGFKVGVLLFAGFLLQVTGLSYTTASKSAFITGLNVVIVPFLSKAIADEHVTLYSKMGALLALLGLLLLTSPSGGLNVGDLLTLASAVSFAFQVVYVSKYTRILDSITLASAEIATVAVLSSPAALLSGIPELSLWELAALAYLSLAATLLALLFQVEGQKSVDSTTAAIVFSMEPAFAAFFSWVLLGEVPSRGVLMGGMLILAGMMLSSYKPSSARPSHT